MRLMSIKEKRDNIRRILDLVNDNCPVRDDAAERLTKVFLY